LVLITGGADTNGNALASAELYNIAMGTFSSTGSLNTGRIGFSATLLTDGTVLIAGGYYLNGGSSVAIAQAEIYNPKTGLFTITGDLNIVRTYPTATLLPNGKVLVAGGSDGQGNSLASAEIFDPSNGTFTPTGNMTSTRWFQTATLLNTGKVLMTGGLTSGTVLNSAELYDPVAGTFAAISAMNATRFAHTATLLNTGQVIVAGGYDLNYNTLASAELYDPVAGIFTVTGSLLEGRSSPTATLLSNGQVLYVGGTDQGVNVSDAELFDQTAGAFTATSSPITARYIQTATLLTNGEVLVAGGSGASNAALSSAELYQPTTLVPANLQTIAIAPVNPSIPSGTAQSLVASGTFSGNGTENLGSVTWSSSNLAVLTISNDSSDRGVVSALTPGSATVMACAGTICGSTTASVVAPDPFLSGVSPNSGPMGSAVVISGQGFGTIQGSSTVTVDGIPASVSSWSSTAIGIIIPADTSTGNVLVTVGGASSNLIQFTVLPTPFISEVAPTSGDPTSTITISGDNFGATQGTSTVTLNGLALNVVSWSAATITGTVPTSATSGNVIVSVASVPSNPVSFTVLNAPEIFALNPPLGPVGTSVAISGADFGASQGTSTVTFNGVAATVTGWGSSGVTAIVPPGATTGPVVVNVGGTPSNGVVFVAPGSPNISSLSPYAGLVGTVVTITGTDFGATQGTSTVTFNGTLASPTSWQSTQIVVPVPTGATSGNVTVTSSGVTGSAAYFAVSGPVISSVSRTTGAAGTNVLLQGSHFGPSQGTSTVTINGTPATIASGGDWIDTAIAFVVPSGATTGNLIVTVNGAAANAGTFTVYPTPVITSISASSGLVGSSLTVRGSGFGTTAGTVGISGGNAATQPSWSDSTIVFTVPPGMYYAPGDVVYVNTSLGIGEDGGYQPNFLVLPSVTTLSQNSGTVATSIQINGYGFGYSGTVTFNGTVASPTSWTPAQIVTNPPVGATSGNVVVTVGGNASAGVNFTVQPGPAITALSRSDGVVGTSITITGTGFGTSQGTSTVTFNGTPTTTNTGWSPTSITVPVPSGATTGPLVVTVASVASNGQNFTLDPPPSIGSLSQTSGSVGTSITINGSNFLATQGTSTVTFNGTSATPTSWSPYAITANVPTGTTTGNVVVTVLGQASAGVKFTVNAAPSISTLSPTSGPTGTLLTVNGSNFGSSQGSSFVTMNGVLTVPASWASGKITVPVPEGTTTGPVLVTVNNGPSNASTFTVTNGPGITTISPSSGGIGATVTISGAGFGATQGSSTLKFNGTTAIPASWSDMSITVPVPTGATTGNIVATVGGTASNGVSFTVSSGLSVTSISPNSGNTGTVVTITGTGFGATQGGSKVMFNGASAIVTAWGNTSITASVPSAATSGALVVTVGGASSDGVYFTSQPLIDSISPNPAAVDAVVTIAGQNFGATQGSSVVTCNGTPFPVATWSANSIVMQQGCAQPNGAPPAAVPIQISVNAVSSAMASIQSIPDASLNPRVSPTYASVGTPILVRGQNLGATQGQSTITVNGAAGTPTSWSSTAIVVPVPSGAAANGLINVTVGGVAAYPSAGGPVVGSYPTPTSLQITPAGVNMLIGAAQQFVVFDNLGLQRFDATWSIDNTNLASISTDSPPTLTALAAGIVTLTATVQGVSSQMPVTISAASAFPNGTILWSAPPNSGFSPAQIAQAVPTPYGPSVYSIETSSTQTLVGAFTSDGEEMWQNTLSASIGSAVADGTGGLIVTEACNPANPSGYPMTVTDLDGISGATLWSAEITSASNACPPGPPKMAIRQDGLVVIAAPLQTSPALVFAGGPFGTAPAIPPSTITDQFGNVQTCDCYSPVGQPIVDTDGSIYLEYEVRQLNLSNPDISSALYLMRISPAGSTTSTQLSSSDQANLFPGSLMPDGNGGVVATWTIVNTQLPVAPQPYQAAFVVSGSVVSSYPLPLAPTQVVNGSNGLPVNPSFVLGENGTAFVAYTSNFASFNFSGGVANWNYAVSQGISSISYANGGGIILADSQGNQTPIDSTGTAGTSVPLSASLLQASWTGNWQGAFPSSNIPLASITAPGLDWGPSGWASAGGNPSPSGTSIKMPIYPPLQGCIAPTICASNALVTGLNALYSTLNGNCPDCGKYVFTKIGSSGDQAKFAAFVNRKPNFYDGTRSTLPLQSISGDMATADAQSVFLEEFGTNTTVADYFTANPDAEALAVYQSTNAQSPTGTKGLIIFVRPSKVCTDSALTTGSGCQLENQSLLFHEGLHEYYDLGDPTLQRLLHITVQACSGNITDYIEFTTFNVQTDFCGDLN
jgi:hypothetical protein